MEKELVELRERLAKVEEWKARKTEIESELERVWVDGGDELSTPPYTETVDVRSEEGSLMSETSPVSQDEEPHDEGIHSDAVGGIEAEIVGTGGGEGLFGSSSSWNPAHRPS